MLIKLTQPIVVKGYPGIIVGVPEEVEDRLAESLISSGRAVAAAATIQNREPMVENRDPVTQTPQSKSSRRNATR